MTDPLSITVSYALEKMPRRTKKAVLRWLGGAATPGQLARVRRAVRRRAFTAVVAKEARLWVAR